MTTAVFSIRPCPPSPPNARQRSLHPLSPVIQALKSGKRGDDDYHATLKALNSRDRIVPRKSLGQHYMLNSTINDQLSSIAGIIEGDVVLEIGPGTGSLTNVLINAGATVLAVEKDPYMAMIVKERFGHLDQLTVLQEDITRCHIRSHVSSLLEKLNTGGVVKYAKVVSNIPFNISTDVVKQLLPMGDLFSDVILLLQDEAALRLTEFQMRSSENRPINLFVNFYSAPSAPKWAPLTAEEKQKCAEELAKVNAAIAKFKLKQKSEYPQVTSKKGFFSMVNSAFNEKRKMLRKSLQHICAASEIEHALTTIGHLATARPQELSLEDFVRLHNLISEADQSIHESVS